MKIIEIDGKAYFAFTSESLLTIRTKIKESCENSDDMPDAIIEALNFLTEPSICHNCGQWCWDTENSGYCEECDDDQGGELWFKGGKR